MCYGMCRAVGSAPQGPRAMAHAREVKLRDFHPLTPGSLSTLRILHRVTRVLQGVTPCLRSRPRRHPAAPPARAARRRAQPAGARAPRAAAAAVRRGVGGVGQPARGARARARAVRARRGLLAPLAPHRGHERLAKGVPVASGKGGRAVFELRGSRVNPLPWPGSGDQPKTPFIAFKSKPRLVNPLFWRK